MNRTCILLFLCVFLAVFYFQTIAGVGIGILEIPLKCYMRVIHGDGKQKLTRYHYNDKTSRCRRFMYTGRNGNGNNFESLAECMRVCKGLPSVEERMPQKLVMPPTTSRPKTSPVETKRAKKKIKDIFNKLITQWTHYFRLIFT